MTRDELELELSQLLNKYSIENGSDTPDFILAPYMLACLRAFDEASIKRAKWFDIGMPMSTTELRPPTQNDERQS